MSDLVLARLGMARDPVLEQRSGWPSRWLRALLLLQLLRWRYARGELPFSSSRHPGFADLLSEQQLLEVQDLTLSLLQGGGLGPLSLLPPDLPDLEPECREMLMDFANSSAELTGCLVRSARPVRLCQTCYPLFQQVASKMDNISRNVGVGREAARHLWHGAGKVRKRSWTVIGVGYQVLGAWGLEFCLPPFCKPASSWD